MHISGALSADYDYLDLGLVGISVQHSCSTHPRCHISSETIGMPAKIGKAMAIAVISDQAATFRVGQPVTGLEMATSSRSRPKESSPIPTPEAKGNFSHQRRVKSILLSSFPLHSRNLCWTLPFPSNSFASWVGLVLKRQTTLKNCGRSWDSTSPSSSSGML